MIYALAAISIGLLGSAHCAGMCAPLLIALNQGKKNNRLELLHHMGRISTYALLGLAAGALGSTFNFIGFQQVFSIAVGVILILSVVGYGVFRKGGGIEAFAGKLTIRFASKIHQMGLSKSAARWLLGAANGILPCGVVYMALAGAANTFTPWDGALFMILFGLATIPMLSGVSHLALFLSPKFKTNIRRLVPITVFVMGLLLVVRGMDLGVPYLSPQASLTSDKIVECE